MTAKPPRRRRAWLAALLSLLQPGLGQLYAGRLWAAALFYLLTTFLIFGAPSALRVAPPRWSAVGFLLFLLLGLAIAIAGVTDAALGARRRAEVPPPWYARWYVCLPVMLLVFLGDWAGSAAGLADLPFRTFHIPSVAMEPTLLVGDYVLARKSSDLPPEIRPCDVVVFRKPAAADAPEVLYVKRVVALAGESVGYAGGRLRLNGEMVAREAVGSDAKGTIYRETLPSGCSYLIRERDDQGPLDEVADTLVPAASFYALGDNRDDSADSRISDIDPIPTANWRALALVVYLAKDRSRIGSWLYPSPSDGDAGGHADADAKPRASTASP